MRLALTDDEFLLLRQCVSLRLEKLERIQAHAAPETAAPQHLAEVALHRARRINALRLLSDRLARATRAGDPTQTPTTPLATQEEGQDGPQGAQQQGS